MISSAIITIQGALTVIAQDRQSAAMLLQRY